VGIAEGAAHRLASDRALIAAPKGIVAAPYTTRIVKDLCALEGLVSEMNCFQWPQVLLRQALALPVGSSPQRPKGLPVFE
jgi:hypothetical protein